MRSAEAVFGMPRAETHFETLRLSGNASFEMPRADTQKTIRKRVFNKKLTPAGFEPAAYGLGNRRSILLSYGANRSGRAGRAL